MNMLVFCITTITYVSTGEFENATTQVFGNETARRKALDAYIPSEDEEIISFETKVQS